MHLHATYKAFVAKTAASLFTEMVGQSIGRGYLRMYDSFNLDEPEYKSLATHAALAAEMLADELESLWTGKDGGATAFFDVQDTPLTRCEDAIHDVSEKLENIKEKISQL